MKIAIGIVVGIVLSFVGRVLWRATRDTVRFIGFVRPRADWRWWRWFYLPALAWVDLFRDHLRAWRNGYETEINFHG